MRRNAGDASGVRARKQRVGLSLKQRDADLFEVMALPAGRRALFDLLNRRCQFFSMSDCGEATHATAKNEGKRLVGFELLADLRRVAPTHYTAMLVEMLGSDLPSALDDVHSAADSGGDDDGDRLEDG